MEIVLRKGSLLLLMVKRDSKLALLLGETNSDILKSKINYYSFLFSAANFGEKSKFIPGFPLSVGGCSNPF